MSKEDPDDYKYITALVRNLHITKNVSRPSDNESSPRSTLRAPRRTAESESLLDLQLDTASMISDADDTNDDDEGDEGRDIHRSLHKRPVIVPKSKTKGHHQSNTSLNVPSVVITGVHEHVDILSSTQRRFSQLYSGLRRFSASHTVMMIVIIIAQHDLH